MISIVCDQPIWRDALASLLREFSYECPAVPIPSGEWTGVDLILTAQPCPSETFREQLSEARSQSPALRLVCLCEDAAQVDAWQHLDPDGIVLQEDGTPVLVDAVASVLDGRVFRSARILSRGSC